MAIVKAVKKQGGIKALYRYLVQEEKTDIRLITGINCEADTALEEMLATKFVYKKLGGRECKHFVQSFAEGENISPDEAHRIGVKLAKHTPLFKGFEVLVVTHIDRGHLHNHFLVNSVSYEDGHKFQMALKHDLEELRGLSDLICREHGLTITVPGKTFTGEDRTELSSADTDLYNLLQKAEKGKADSYIYNIYEVVSAAKKKAISKEEFIQLLQEQGISCKWEDTRKYITFSDIQRREHGEAKHSVRNKKLAELFREDFSKETLTEIFKQNMVQSDQIGGANPFL